MAPNDRFIRLVKTPGGDLATVQDAADYIESLPARVRDAPPWPEAIKVLIQAAQHGGPFVFIAGIALNNAIHGRTPPPIGTSENPKVNRWGKRKLKRDA